LALVRARETWQKHGRSEKWIQQRMTGQETRNKLTDYWATHEIKKGEEYASCDSQRRERGGAGEHQGAAMKDGWQKNPLGELCKVLDHKHKPVTKRDRERFGRWVLADGTLPFQEQSQTRPRRAGESAKWLSVRA